VKLRLGTRSSRLALAQTRSVAEALAALGAEIEVVPIKTSGDHLAQVALADFGGKALFVREIEEALLAGRIDVGVHSLKDLPAELPSGLALGAFPRREDPRDTLVTRHPATLDDLPGGAVVGTSSLRRRVFVLSRRPDLRVEPIRGNVETRLAKLEGGSYDAVVLARAGLARLGLAPAHEAALDAEEFVPAVGQGILGVEVRASDRDVTGLVGRLDHPATGVEARAERAFLERLGAGCHTPVAGHARLDGRSLGITGIVASADAGTVLRSSLMGPASSAEALGRKVADELLARGAGRLLAAAGAGG
jgi:hydroxymethylbilane synthase